MEIIEKYRFGELLRDGAVQTHAGSDLSSGARVFIHRLGAGRTQVDLMRLVVRRLRDAPPGEPCHVLDMFESQGNVYVVTDVIEAFSDLETWLGSSTSETGVRVPEAAQPSAAELRSTQGEPPKDSPARLTPAGTGQTIILQSPTAGGRTPATLPSEFARHTPPAPRQESTETPKRSAPEAPGEFTRIFEAPQTRRSYPSEPSAPHFPATREPESTPGEFTQFFQPSLGDAPAPLLEDASSSGQGPSAGHEPGDLTRILGPGASSSVDATGRSGLGFDLAANGSRGSSDEQGFTGFFGELSAREAPSIEKSGPEAPSGSLALQTPPDAAPSWGDAGALQKPDASFSGTLPAAPRPSAPPVQERVEAPKPEIPKPPSAPPVLPSPPAARTYLKAPAESLPAQALQTRRPAIPPAKIPRPSLSPQQILPDAPKPETTRPSVLWLAFILGGLLLGALALVLFVSK